ncbi:small subunit ribosomal protein S2e [Nematocida sp. AWRm80]|nr:small subunit ribosomal protein S2e [Nematocida sp. AWRm80]
MTEAHPRTTGVETAERTEKSERPQRKQMRKPREEKKWEPQTDLGILVHENKVTLEDIYRNSLSIKESEIVDHLIGSDLKSEMLCMRSIQKQTRAGQRTRMKAVVVVGDGKGNIGIGMKSAKEPRAAIEKATEAAKNKIQPIYFGYWDREMGEPHTVKVKGSGKCGSVNMSLTPAPRGTGIVASTIPKKIFQLAGLKDVFTRSKGCTATGENLAMATVAALQKCNGFYTPKNWETPEPRPSPYQEHYSTLVNYKNKKSSKPIRSLRV